MDEWINASGYGSGKYLNTGRMCLTIEKKLWMKNVAK